MIPVVMGVFQPPGIGTVNTDERRIEKGSIKKRDLCPERIPAAFQQFQILEIIKCSHDGRNNRNGDERQINDGMF